MFNSLSLRAFVVLCVCISLTVGCSSGDEVRGTALIEGEYSRRFIPQDMSVKIIQEKDMIDFHARKSVSIKSSVDSLEGQRKSMRENLDKLGKIVSEGRSMVSRGNALVSQLSGQLAGGSNVPCEVDPFTNEYDCSARDARLGAIRSRIPAARGMIASGARKVAEGEAMLSRQNEALQGVERAVIGNFASGSLLENLPTPVATAVVNSYGEFVIELPKGRYALVASSAKNDLAIQEELLWMFWIDVSGNGITKIDLNKNNLFFTDFAQNVFKLGDFVKPSHPRQ